MVMAGLAHGAHFAAGAATAVKDAGAVGLEPTHGDTGGHLESLGDFARLRIDRGRSFALLGLHGAVPELAVHPGDAGDEAIRFDLRRIAPFSASI